VYPPVSPKPVPRRVGPRENFVLVLGRLVSYKRVDLAIQAGKRLGLKVVVAGTGPDRDRLERVAIESPGAGSVDFLGEIDEQRAGDLLERCRAFVFCAEEDFGIAPVEANAHGTPVVGYGRGGLCETMLDGSTAVLFAEQSLDALTTAIESAVSREWDEEALRRNAERFSPETFRGAFASAVRAAMSSAASA
jgi:glycosyltransferase involved in cell wall biosynthesis